MLEVAGLGLVGASEAIHVEDRQLTASPRRLALRNILNDDAVRQSSGQDVCGQSQGPQGEPMGLFFAKLVAAVDVANPIRRGAAAGDQEDAPRR